MLDSVSMDESQDTESLKLPNQLNHSFTKAVSNSSASERVWPVATKETQQAEIVIYKICSRAERNICDPPPCNES